MRTSSSSAYGRLKRALDKMPSGKKAPDLLARLQALEALLFELLHDRAWIDANCLDFRAPTDRYVLDVGKDRRYMVVSQRFAPGTRSSAHNHHTWGLIGVWRGKLREERFSKSARAAAPGKAYIRATTSTILQSGSVVWFPPPPGDIHRLGCEGDRPAFSLHLYGKTEPSDRYNFRTGPAGREILATERPE